MGLLAKFKNLKTTERFKDRFLPPISSGTPLDSDIYRYRYLTGPNIGGMFLNEREIDDEVFAPDSKTGGSELSALESWGEDADLETLRHKWETHWENFITEADWKFMQSKDVTCVRLPIGFWNLLNPEKHTAGTPFEKYKSVYVNSWKHIVAFVTEAQKYGIGVVIDVHVLQGGVHGATLPADEISEEHLLKRHKLRNKAIETLVETVQLCSFIPNVIAVQLVNEASFAETGLVEFYKEVTSKIEFKLVNTFIQVVISDAWDAHKWGEFDDLILDSRIYRPSNSRYTQMTAQEHIKSALNCVHPVRNQDVIVGEWEPALDSKSLEMVEDDVLDLQTMYGLNLIECFKRLAGNFFWTYKFGENKDGGVCDFRTMSERGVYLHKLDPSKITDKSYQESYDRAIKEYRAYLEKHEPMLEFEEWSFAEGFKQGWSDSIAFAKVNGSRIGRLNSWQDLRYHQHSYKSLKRSKPWVYKTALVSAVHSYIALTS